MAVPESEPNKQTWAKLPLIGVLAQWGGWCGKSLKDLWTALTIREGGRAFEAPFVVPRFGGSIRVRPLRAGNPAVSGTAQFMANDRADLW